MSDKITPGGPINRSSRVWNGFVDAAEDYKRRALASGTPTKPHDVPTDKIKVYNSTGGARRQGDVVACDPLILTDLAAEYLWFDAAEPSATEKTIAILRQQLPAAEIGEAQVSGVCIAWINVTDTDHRRARVISGSCVLESTATGGQVEILYKPGSTGELLCVVVFGANPALDIIGFELTATLALSGSAAAVTVENDIATSTVVTVYDPYDSEGMWAGISGYRGLAIRYPTDATKADILWMEQTAAWIEFTTTEAMGYSTAGQASATVNFYDHQGKNPGSTVNVRDPQSVFADVPTGAKGSADYDYHNGYYRIRRCQRIALFADALLNGNNCGASSPSIDNFAVIPQGEYALAPATAPTTCDNSLAAHGGVDNDPVVLMRTNAAGTTWRLVDVKKHAITVVDATTIRVKSGGLYLEGETVAIYIERCASAGYSNLIALTESTYVSNIPTDSDSINQTKRKVRAFGDDATDVTTDVIGIEACP